MVDMKAVCKLLVKQGVTPIAWKIDEVAEKILNHINADGIPDGLLRVFTKLCSDYVSGGATTVIEGTGAVKSVSEGDFTVQFDVGSHVVTQDVGDFVSGYVSSLNQYRSPYFKKTDYKWTFGEVYDEPTE